MNYLNITSYRLLVIGATLLFVPHYFFLAGFFLGTSVVFPLISLIYFAPWFFVAGFFSILIRHSPPSEPKSVTLIALIGNILGAISASVIIENYYMDII
jgi:hypothetical protein